MRILCAIIVGAVTPCAFAGELTVPNTFLSGTTAVAAEVNANFDAVETAVNDNDGRITTNSSDISGNSASISGISLDVGDLQDRAWNLSGIDLYFDTGNVAIGTVSPGPATMHLLNSGSTGSERVLTAFSPNEPTGNYSGSIFFGDSDTVRETGHLSFVDNAIDGNERINFAIFSAGDLMAIQGNGNVGIGTSSPNFPLEMASGAHVSAGGVWTDASSREYKENIRDLSYDEARSALSSLRPAKFNYKADQGDDYLGFIAEDVPDLVATRDRKGLSPMDIVAVLTKVIQRQQQEIDELKLRIEE